MPSASPYAAQPLPRDPFHPDSPQADTPNRRNVLLAGIAVVLCTALYEQVPLLVKQPHRIISGDILYLHALLRSAVLLFGGFLTGWLLQPSAAAWLHSARGRVRPGTRRALAAAAVALACLFVAAFLVFFGRRHFGAWDFGILIETGYRQLLGQQPFVDFAAPTPPFFNWTAALAFRLFGLRWDANLYLAALFSMGTLVWSFALLRRLGLTTFAALGTSTLIEVAAMLTCCFWWYNNTTLLLSALFFLASLLLLRSPRSLLAQLTYAVLLAVLPLTKPNIAGVTLLGCVALLLIGSRERLRVLLLTLAGLAGTALLFATLHVSVPAMLATYRGIAKERGGLSAFGFKELSLGEQGLVILWTLALCVPLLLILRPLLDDLRGKRWTQASYWLFFPLTAVVGVYGLLGNGEYRDVEFPLLVCAIALLAFRNGPGEKPHPTMRRFTVALLCAMAACDLYVGAARLRVYTVGPHAFFEWGDDDRVVSGGFFDHLHGSHTLIETDREVRTVVDASAGPLFFGPRVDFEYAALHLPSPTGWATFFQPGTAFGRDRTPTLVRAWEAHRFQTLIFLKQNYTFFPDELMNAIARDYVRDDRYTYLSVYRRRPEA